MSQPLRVLLVDDRQGDALLILHELRRAGFEADWWRRVEDEPAFLAHIEPAPDIILADDSLPRFDARRALHLVRDRGLDVPVLIVTGAPDDEAAVEFLRLGAADYLRKDRLARLGQAVEHVLQQRRERAWQRQAAAALRAREARQAAILGAAPDPIITFDHEGRILEINPAAEAAFGSGAAAAVGRPLAELVTLPDRDTPGPGRWVAVTGRRADGGTFPAEWAVRPLGAAAGRPSLFVGFLRDVTAHRRAEDEPPTAPGRGPGPSTPPPILGATPSSRTLRTLLVEDHPDTLRCLARLLGLGRHAVRTAADLASARRLAAAEEFDLIICDIELPDGTGLELMRELRGTRHVAGIALSGYGAEEDVRLSHEAGFAAHLTKPVEFPTLEAVIRSVTPVVGRTAFLPPHPPPYAHGVGTRTGSRRLANENRRAEDAREP